MGETSSIVSRRPPFLVLTSHSNERRWMSMRWGTSRTFSRLEKLRRARVASTRAKSGDSFVVGKAGAAEGAQSATDQNSRLTYAPSRGVCRPPLGGGRGRHGPRPEAPDM